MEQGKWDPAVGSYHPKFETVQTRSVSENHAMIRKAEGQASRLKKKEVAQMRKTTLCQKFLDNEIKTSPLVIFKKRQEECEELAEKIEEEKLLLKKAKRDF